MKTGNITIRKGEELHALERLHNESDGPAARLLAFREGLRAALDVFGVRYDYFSVTRTVRVMV